MEGINKCLFSLICISPCRSKVDGGMHSRKSSLWIPLFPLPYLVTSVGDVLNSFSYSEGGWWWRFSRFHHLQTMEMIIIDMSSQIEDQVIIILWGELESNCWGWIGRTEAFLLKSHQNLTDDGTGVPPWSPVSDYPHVPSNGLCQQLLQTEETKDLLAVLDVDRRITSCRRYWKCTGWKIAAILCVCISAS